MAKQKVADRAGENDANPALPEDDGTATVAGAELPFSDMIARWLDDGDKLHERVHEPNELAAEVGGHEGRVRAFVENARAHAQRHRRVIGAAALLLVIVSVVAFRRAHLAGAGRGGMVSVESTPPNATIPEPPAPTVEPSNTIVAAPAPQPSAPAVATLAVAPAPASAAPSPGPATPPPPPAHQGDTTAPAVAEVHAVAVKLETKPEMKPEMKPKTEPQKHASNATALASTAAPVAVEEVRKPRTTGASTTTTSAPPLEACKSALIRQRSRDALAACSQVFGGDPRSADNMVLLARADLLAGRTGETLTLARRAVAANPRQADAYLLIGTIQQTSGQRIEARTAYETYLQLSPYGAHASDVKAILKTL